MLKHDQSVHLVRSIRKVEVLLGELPLFFDSSSAAFFTFPVTPNPVNGIKADENNSRSASAAPTRLPTLRPRAPTLTLWRIRPSASSSLSFNLSLHRPRTSSDSSLAFSLNSAD
ncbi:hypothetical protein C8R44DRAFT_978126 [Mycena epipterygia]|nr:hypothetical protein C8R44DRAFT_978126 [Mycena epipterygia]